MKAKTYKNYDVMNRGQKVAYAALMIIGAFLTIRFGTWWFSLRHIPNNFSGFGHITDILAFVLLSYVVWYQITYELFSWYITSTMKRPQNKIVPQKGMRVALLTAFVPGKEPYEMLEKTLKAMIAVEYKHDTWVLDEGNDDATKKLCKKDGVIHYSRKGKSRFNTEEGKFKAKTKAGNYNSWFEMHSSEYDIVAQHDVDFVPSKDFFNATLGYFRDPNVAFVGTPQIYGNKNESWIARGAAEQAYGFYGPVQKGLHGHDMSLLIGANHVVRVAAHDDIDGYSGHIVEDHLTGMKFYSKKWKSVYVPKILAIGEGPATWDAYFGQQMRWAYGLMDILFRHSPSIFPKLRNRHMINYFLLQQYYFYGIAQVIGVFLMSLYFFFGFQATSMETSPLFTTYLPLIAFQFCVFFWLQRFNVDPIKEKGLLIRGRILSLAAWPIYFAAFVGALLGRKLTYAVTPKGGEQTTETHHSLFYPHFVLGTISLFGLIAGKIFGHMSPQIVFWTVLNTVVMYGFCIAILSQPSYLAAMKKTLRKFFGLFIRKAGPVIGAAVAIMLIVQLGKIPTTINYVAPAFSYDGSVVQFGPLLAETNTF